MEKDQAGILLRQVSEALATIVEGVADSIVRVEGRRRGHASGVAWSKDGLVVTAHHSVQRDHDLRIGLPGGEVVPADLVGRDPTTDLALLRARDADLKPPPWDDVATLSVGHLVLSVGRHDAHAQASLGIVSKKEGAWRAPMGGEIEAYLQTDITIYPGFSGSALVNAEGHAVGVNTSGLLRGASLALPAVTVQRVVATLLEHGRVRRGYLGIGAHPARLPGPAAEALGQAAGLLVFTVEPESPAADAGVFAGDFIVGLDGEPVQQMDDLLALLGGERVGRAAPLRVVRGGAVQEFTVTMGERD